MVSWIKSVGIALGVVGVMVILFFLVGLLVKAIGWTAIPLFVGVWAFAFLVIQIHLTIYGR